MKKLNNKGIGLIDLMVGIIIIGAIVLLLSNYLSLQKASMKDHQIYLSMYEAFNKEYVDIYNSSNWDVLEDTTKTMDKNVEIKYKEYILTSYNTELITLSVVRDDIEWTYHMERMIPVE